MTAGEIQTTSGELWVDTLPLDDLQIRLQITNTNNELDKWNEQSLSILQAAAVFDVGADEQSPSENTFLYLVCWRVCLSTDTKLVPSTRGEFHNTDGVDIGGATCSIEY